MQTIQFTIQNTENVGHLDLEQVKHIQEVVVALISSGGLTGVKGGKTIIHFDDKGAFRGVELSYWPWRKRSVDRGV